MKKVILIFSLMVLSYTSNSQISLGGQAVYNRYIGAGVGNLGVGVFGDKASDRFNFRLSVNYFLRSKKARDYDLYENTLYDGQSYYGSVAGFEKYSGLAAWLDVSYFFTGDAENGGFYGFAGLGLNYMNVSYELGAHSDQYFTIHDYTEKDRIIQPIIRAGLGYDIDLDFGNLFIQAHGNMPATTVNGAAIDVNLPFSFGGSVGVRVPIN